MRRGIPLIAFVLGGAASPPLEPTSKWIVDYRTDGCSVSRSYATAEKPVVLSIESNVTSPHVTLNLIDSRVQGARASRVVHVTFAPGAEEISADGQTFPVGPNAVQKVTFFVPEDQEWQLSAAASIAASVRAMPSVTVRTPGVAAALAALEKCRVDLMSSWGFSPEDQARLKVKAKAEGGNRPIYLASDYPETALRNHQQGATTARVIVAADGRPSECVVVRSSGSSILDTTTCRVIMKRARYSPALDASGRAMASVELWRTNWVVPE